MLRGNHHQCPVIHKFVVVFHQTHFFDQPSRYYLLASPISWKLDPQFEVGMSLLCRRLELQLLNTVFLDSFSWLQKAIYIFGRVVLFGVEDHILCHGCSICTDDSVVVHLFLNWEDSRHYCICGKGSISRVFLLSVNGLILDELALQLTELPHCSRYHQSFSVSCGVWMDGWYKLIGCCF